MAPRSAWLLVALCACLAGCPTTDQSLVLVGGDHVLASDIDAAPLALLPSGALLVGELDAPQLFKSHLSGQVGEIVSNVLPLGPESNFSAARDVDRVFSAFYAMQGADFVAVLRGRFDIDAIARSAQAQAATPSGARLSAVRYAEYEYYTAGKVGFVPLTARTMLSGSVSGIRRALDRLRYGKLRVVLTPWMAELLADRRAAFTLVGDVTDQAVVESMSERLPFLYGLRYVRVLGNFEAPGMNVVGSFTYHDEPQAERATAALGQLQRLAFLASLLSSLGFGGAPKLEVARQGYNVAFATGLDDTTVGLLLALVTRLTAPS
jgi:hypothetical protein